jgi:LmbE family N-acetylglucosaminyl deacetylase
VSLLPERLDRMVLLGAHCAEIAVGAGGALIELCRAHPGVVVTAVVLTGGGSLREEEERAALAAFCPGAKLEVVVHDLPDGRVATRTERLSQVLEEVHALGDPELVLTPSPHDVQPDHRALVQAVPAVFTDNLVLGYELLAVAEGLPQPSVFLPLAEPVLREKIAKLHEHYGSQQDRTGFDGETFAGLARIRGAQCRARYAEAFHAGRIVLGVAPLTGTDPIE